MADEQLRAFQKVSCLCGTQIRVDPLSQDRRVTCPNCGGSFDFVVNLDTRKRSKVSIVLPRAAMKTEGESLGKASAKPARKTSTPPPKAPTPAPKPAPTPAPATRVTKVNRKVSGKTVHALMGNCECGASFPLEDTGELTSLQSCPQCNRTFHVVFKLEPGTHRKTAMLVAEKPPPQRSGRKAATQTAKTPPLESRVTDFFTPARKSRTRVTKPRTKTPPEIPPGAQGVPCSCGEIFVVRKKDLDSEKTCEGCGRTASFEEARDPQTLAPLIRIRANRQF